MTADARRALTVSVTEEELLTAITDALTVYQWHALGWSEDFPNATNLDRVRLRVWWPEDLDRALKELA